MYKIEYSKRAIKEIKWVKSAKLEAQVKKIIEIVRKDPFFPSNDYEALKGDLLGYHSRRINRKHRFVYQVLEDKKIIRIMSIWSHYERLK